MSLPATPAAGQFDGGCVFIDGTYAPLSEAKISMFDWGFTRSDVTYDVVSAWHGAFFRIDTHMDRFFASLQKMRLAIPYTRAELREILHGVVRAGGLQDAYVAMLCTRGVPPRGARDPRGVRQSNREEPGRESEPVLEKRPTVVPHRELPRICRAPVCAPGALHEKPERSGRLPPALRRCR